MMTRLECNEFEVLLCDYVDNTLNAEGRARVDAHAASCASCAALKADVTGVMDFVDRVPGVEVPKPLVTKILFERPALEKQAGVLGWLRGLFAPILQPKFAMGMAMTVLSFSMLSRITGISFQLKPADLEPMNIYHALDDNLYRGWERAVKYYENLRVVYEIQTRLHEWNEQDEEERRSQQKTEPPPVESSVTPGSGKK